MENKSPNPSPLASSAATAASVASAASAPSASSVASASSAATTASVAARRLGYEEMKEAMNRMIGDDLSRQASSVNGLMIPALVDVNPAEQSATLRFSVLPWEANRVSGLHGGIMAAMLDHTCGLTASCYLGHWAPTMSLSVEYIRPANMGDCLLATATLMSMGRRLIRMRGELRQESSGKLVATCSATFFNKD
jgi:uncharacterized protein (TIGR00369 family)